MSSSHGYVERDGEEIYYEAHGAPDAPVVVLGHGAGGNHGIWFQQLPDLTRDYRVITWDQRGFGLSTNRHELANPRVAAADLLAILDHLEVARAHVVGQSMGGWAALGLALAYPERVRTLVLSDTLGGINVEGWWNTAASVPPRAGPFNHPALSNEFCAPRPERAHLYLKIGGLRRDPHADQSPMLRGMGEVTFADDLLAALTIPTLFVVGSADELFPPASVADAASRIPGARVEIVDGAGHSPYFEQPETWNSLVRGFWANSS